MYKTHVIVSKCSVSGNELAALPYSLQHRAGVSSESFALSKASRVKYRIQVLT